MVQRFLRVTSISEEMRKTPTSRPYFVVKVEPKYSLPDGTPVFCELAEGTRVVFGEWQDDKGNVFKADALFKLIQSKQIKIGALVEGQLVRVKTTPYEIPGSDRPATHYTCAVFQSEDVSEHVDRQLKSKYASMIGEGGIITSPNQLTRPTSAQEVEEETVVH